MKFKPSLLYFVGSGFNSAGVRNKIEGQCAAIEGLGVTTRLVVLVPSDSKFSLIT